MPEEQEPNKLVCMAIIHSLWSQRPSECHANMLDAGTAPPTPASEHSPPDTGCYTSSNEAPVKQQSVLGVMPSILDGEQRIPVEKGRGDC